MNIPEKNKRIAELISIATGQKVIVYGNTVSLQTIGSVGKPLLIDYNQVDYYSSWNDLMPLIDELSSKIETFNRSTHVIARVVTTDNTKSFTSKGSDLQHALADCLLKVLEERSK